MLVALHPPDEIPTSEYPWQAPREAPHHIEKKSTLGHALFLLTRCSDAGAMLPKQRPIELADAQASGGRGGAGGGSRRRTDLDDLPFLSLVHSASDGLADCKLTKKGDRNLERAKCECGEGRPAP